MFPRKGRGAANSRVPGSTPNVLFLGLAYAGHRTRLLNLVEHTRDDPRIRPTYRTVTGWQDGGLIERLPLVPAQVKGRARAIVQAGALAAFPRPDVIWTAVVEVAAPYVWSQLGPLRRPLILDLDCTFDQLEDLSAIYFGRPPRQGARRALGRLQERLLWRSVSVFTAWSQWAADSLRRAGIPSERIEVLPPGVDLRVWRPRSADDPPASRALRLLFVGGDFARKGGALLLDVFSARFADRCELNIVTHESVAPRPGVRVHRAEPNAPLLRDLYAHADLFVLPTQAECFGIATVEALASGLPVIMGEGGGARDIVDENETGWLIPPTAPALAAALERALAERERFPAMGRRARTVAEARFDGARNDGRMVDLVLELAAGGANARAFGAKTGAHRS